MAPNAGMLLQETSEHRNILKQHQADASVNHSSEILQA